jgi:hypothetical protein
MTKNWKKFTVKKKKFWTSQLQEKPSALKREQPTLQKMKFLNFFYFCGSLLTPGSGSETLSTGQELYREQKQLDSDRRGCKASTPSRIGCKRAGEA